MVGRISEVILMLILLCNRQNTAARKVYWLMGISILEAHANNPFFSSGMRELINHNYYVFKKANKQVLGKICNFTINSDHGYKKVKKQGW